MKRNVFVFSMVLSLLLSFSPTVYADSSWGWYWENGSPAGWFLPFAVIFTLLIETFGVIKFSSIKATKGRIIAVVAVCVANAVSYLLPYLFSLNDSIESFSKILEEGYIQVLGYLILTLIFEVPIVYLSLQKHVESQKRLFITALAVNIITTLLVSLTMRIMYPVSFYAF